MRWRVFLIWAFFLIRGAFYCSMLPLWEGWDEYAHFAWLQHWLDHGTLPDFHDPVSKEIDESMRLAPLAHELQWIGPPYLTHPQWWALPESERAARRQKLAALPTSFAHQPTEHRFDFYEAQQPPLYYWILSVPLRLVPGWPIEERVRLFRLLSMAIASLAIPLCWLAGRRILGEAPALFCTALLAAAPGFAIDVSRVANDCFAILFVSLLFWLLAQERAAWWWVGLTLGAGLLSKAYLLALLPGIVVIWWRRRADLFRALLLALLVASWWYGRNLLLGRSLSGWLLHPSSGKVLAGVWHINWLSAAHVIAKSFLWFGGWSFLTLKAWIYAVVELSGLAALLLALRTRNNKGLAAPAVLTGAYLLGMFWGVAVYFASQNVPNLPGWYLWPMGSMIAVLLTAGLQRYTVLLIGALAAIDVYGVAALLAPYYAGLVERNHASAGLFPAALARLGVPPWFALAWFAATLSIVVLAGMTDYGVEKTRGHQR